jgi:hypothetical protein
MRRALLIGFLAACESPPTESGGGEPPCTQVFYADADGDGHGDPATTSVACAEPTGFTTTRDDCDDTNTAIHPGADEVCNELDDDCDGAIDVGAIDRVVYFLDRDDDGFGDDTTMDGRCTPPMGSASVGGDCDDTNADVHPAADELCNGWDDDCDDLVDVDDPDVQGAAVWFADADQDAFGDPDSGTLYCLPPDGAVVDGTDCDDTNPAVHPQADEVCNEIDDDCDELVDDEDPFVTDRPTFYLDADDDGLGDAAAPALYCFLPKGYAHNDDDCDDTDAAVGGVLHFYRDYDCDGVGGEVDGYNYYSCASTWICDSLVTGDCSEDSAVYPGAPEVCDDKDNNCDGLVDEDDPLLTLTTWSVDADGDGYGDASDSFDSCDGRVGYVDQSGDCDDADADVNPDAIEFCDGIDNDCTGTVDDDPVYLDWFADDDADGFGDASDVLSACIRPSGYVRNADDCDDADAGFSPDVADICNDDADQDCDGYVDNCEVALAEADFVAEGPVADQAFPTMIATADLNADGVADLLFGAPGGRKTSGAVYAAFGPATGVAKAGTDVGIRSEIDDIAFGATVAGGDADGDGFDDVLAAAPYTADDVYLFLGPLSGDYDLSDADTILDGPASGTRAADRCALDLGSDVDGDGIPDVLVGIRQDGDGTGEAYVVSGSTSGTIVLTTGSTYLFSGDAPAALLGTNVLEIGDTSGDGIGDIALTQTGIDRWGTTAVGRDAAFVVEGGLAPGAYVAGSVADATIRPPDYESFGDTLTAADYDGDGARDLIVGASSAYEDIRDPVKGAVYVFLGPLSGAGTTDDAYAIWHTGAQQIAVGNLDGDDSQDLVIGAATTSLQLGAVSGTVDVAAMITLPAGGAVALVPDWSGDGADELALSAVNADTSTEPTAGVAYVFFSETFY